jgi:hypothetical protein
VIEIEHPPTIAACSTCMSPLTWIYVFHLGRTVAAVPVDGPDRFTFRLHLCGASPMQAQWRYAETQPPEVRQRGAALARAVLAGDNPFTEEEERHG